MIRLPRSPAAVPALPRSDEPRLRRLPQRIGAEQERERDGPRSQPGEASSFAFHCRAPCKRVRALRARAAQAEKQNSGLKARDSFGNRRQTCTAQGATVAFGVRSTAIIAATTSTKAAHSGSPGRSPRSSMPANTPTIGTGSEDIDDTATGSERASVKNAQCASVPARKTL